MAGDTETNSEITNDSAAIDQPTDGIPDMFVTLDIADAVSAVVWPLVLILVVLVLRKHLPAFFSNLPKLFDRVHKISVGNFSLEMAKGAAFAPQWTPTDSALDIRKSMSSAEVTDSTAGHFSEQLIDTTPGDFALVDLEQGEAWLSSRLYILSILLERSKDIGAFVFVRTVGKRSKKLVGWAEPRAIRWSLARRYPWFEGAYARSYSVLFPAPPIESDVQIVSGAGMLGWAQEGASPQLLIQLLEVFLGEIQSPAMPIPEEEDQWVEIRAATTTWEHACWLTADDIEDILGDELQKQYVRAIELDGMTNTEGAQRLLQVSQRYVPVVDDKERFRELIDRQIVLDQVAAELVRA